MWLRLWLLDFAARKRSRQIQRELPTVLELLSVCVSAGQALPDALRRIAPLGSGPLLTELQEVVRLTSLGISLTEALEALSNELNIPAVSRLTTQLCSALERGSPIIDVLNAQARDQRVQSTRHLLEVAGMKEIAMMLPLVFLILPTTVLFAVWPGLVAFDSGLLK
ncbi:MAG: type II secretion system F family protein [Agromyces sp.]